MSARRGFTVVELVITLAVVAVAVSIAVQISMSAKEDVAHSVERDQILEFFRRERTLFVNRGSLDEVLIFCTIDGVDGGPCDGPIGVMTRPPGNGLVAYRARLPVTFPIQRDREQGRIRFSGGGAFDRFGAPGTSPTQWSMTIDPLSRVVPADGQTIDGSVVEREAVNRSFTLSHDGKESTIFFRADGLVVTTWGQGYGQISSPRLANVGSRTTPNATPLAGPSVMPARRVLLE